jgi:hypothetical protein
MNILWNSLAYILARLNLIILAVSTCEDSLIKTHIFILSSIDICKSIFELS